MKFYYAPLEGITNYIYRNAYHKYFYPCDKYFTPFISPNQNRSYNSKELRDILPENNQGLVIVPQILSNHAEQFIRACKDITQLGYREINLNLGCPSGTVVAKGKGSGFLAHPDRLDAFFDQIFSKLDSSSIKISVKTRIGKESSDDFEQILEIYNRYPIEELIIHPRVQTDFYRNVPNLEVFSSSLQNSRHIVCYNGDIFTLEHFRKIKERFPTLEVVMLGRGLIANPWMLYQIVEDSKESRNNDSLKEWTTHECKQRVKDFHNQVLEGYKEIMSGDRDVLFRMKELWFYLIHLFTEPEQYVKRIKKAEKLSSYEEIVNRLFEEQQIKIIR